MSSRAIVSGGLVVLLRGLDDDLLDEIESDVRHAIQRDQRRKRGEFGPSDNPQAVPHLPPLLLVQSGGRYD